jgi:hypothetical protein
MLEWIKKLFLGFDRQARAVERTARAFEDIAEDAETLRDQFRAKLRGELPDGTIVTEVKTVTSEEARALLNEGPEEQVPTTLPGSNGKKRGRKSDKAF